MTIISLLFACYGTPSRLSHWHCMTASLVEGRGRRALVSAHKVGHIMDRRGHLNRKLRFQGFCRFIRLIERVFWSFYSTVRSDMQYWLAFSWPYNLLSDKALRITVYSCANTPAGPSPGSLLSPSSPHRTPCPVLLIAHDGWGGRPIAHRIAPFRNAEAHQGRPHQRQRGEGKRDIISPGAII
jgi:hypothetical protein